MSNRFAQCRLGIRDGDGGPRGGPAGGAALGGSRVLPTRRLGSTGLIVESSQSIDGRNRFIDLLYNCGAADRCWHSIQGLLRELPPGRYSAACQENFLPTHPPY